jgi:FAD dependent oxidoreductase TIGR03364
MSQRYDDAVIGAGIIGLAHAYHLASRGRRVVVFERHARARGASVRNFGMLWPIGQPAGPLRDLALRSRAIWLDVLTRAGLWHDRCGSLHLAYCDDEAVVLGEFARAANAAGFPCEILEAGAVVAKCPHVRRAGLVGALWSPNETCIDPRLTLAALPLWLSESLGVTFEFDTQITVCDPPRVLAGTREWSAECIWICGGDDLQTLYPDALRRAGLVRCKLQMMRSEPMSWRLGPMLAAGLTLRHYRGFEACPTLPAVSTRLAREWPDHARYGIHVMVSQNGRGELVIGDSHEYDDDIEPFDKSAIEQLILGYLCKFLEMPDLQIAERWHGFYVKHPSDGYLVARPEPGVVAVTGVGGAGMTMSFGVAEQVVREVVDY